MCITAGNIFQIQFPPPLPEKELRAHKTPSPRTSLRSNFVFDRTYVGTVGYETGGRWRNRRRPVWLNVRISVVQVERLEEQASLNRRPCLRAIIVTMVAVERTPPPPRRNSPSGGERCSCGSSWSRYWTIRTTRRASSGREGAWSSSSSNRKRYTSRRGGRRDIVWRLNTGRVFLTGAGERKRVFTAGGHRVNWSERTT